MTRKPDQGLVDLNTLRSEYERAHTAYCDKINQLWPPTTRVKVQLRAGVEYTEATVLDLTDKPGFIRVQLRTGRHAVRNIAIENIMPLAKGSSDA